MPNTVHVYIRGVVHVSEGELMQTLISKPLPFEDLITRIPIIMPMKEGGC